MFHISQYLQLSSLIELPWNFYVHWNFTSSVYSLHVFISGDSYMNHSTSLYSFLDPLILYMLSSKFVVRQLYIEPILRYKHTTLKLFFMCFLSECEALWTADFNRQ